MDNIKQIKSKPNDISYIYDMNQNPFYSSFFFK